MKPRVSMVVLVVLSMCAAESVRADPLDLKLGLWETTFTSRVSGTLIPDAVLQKMSPDQRAQMEAMMKKQQADGPKTRTSRTCLTRERLAQPFEKMDAEGEKDCKRTTLVATRSKQEIAIVCTGDHAQKREWHMEATSRESAKGNVKVLSGNGSVTMDFTAKWVASECGTAD